MKFSDDQQAIINGVLYKLYLESCKGNSICPSCERSLREDMEYIIKAFDKLK